LCALAVGPDQERGRDVSAIQSARAGRVDRRRGDAVHVGERGVAMEVRVDRDEPVGDVESRRATYADVTPSPGWKRWSCRRYAR
jgi:hypothetical protein